MEPAHNTYLIVEAAGRHCAFPLAVVMETMRPLAIEPAARAPGFVLGMAVIRGAVTPVLDLALVLGGERMPPSRFVTVRAGERVVALAAAAVLGLRGIEPAQLREAPPLISAAEPGAVEHIALHDGLLLHVLNAARLVPEETWSTVTRGGGDGD
jgi:purine-binding chemotaxis protein CheW